MIRAALFATVLAALPAAAQETPEAPAPPPPEVTEAEAVAPLEAAFQKEFAYLAAERAALEDRIAAQKAEGARTRSEADSELDRLEARLTALQVQVEHQTSLLEDVDRAATAALEADDALAAAWFQLKSTLDEPEAPLADPEEATYAARASAFAEGFRRAGDRLAQGRQIRVVPGSWFGADGQQRTSDLVMVGNIATFGVASDEAAALIPVGEDRLQGFREGGGATGRALVAGSADAVMGLYLHEGRTKRIDEREPKTMTDILEAGGTVGYVIVGLGLMAVLLMIVRALTLTTAARGDAAVDAAVARVAEGRIAEAVEAVRGVSGTPARVVAEMLPRLDQPRGVLEDVASAAILKETPRVERFGAAILVIAAVAPLLGLLGTVTGMIATFDIITEFGTGDLRMLSGGISEALVTTQFGLIVAIPSLLGGNLLSGWGEAVMDAAENAALRVLNALEDGGDEDETPELARASK